MTRLSHQKGSATILDCSALFPGALIGKLMAREGARVLKIENPNRPDPTRRNPAYYADYNEMKEHVALDLTKAEDRAKFHELVKNADGLIEGFRPETKSKLGLDEKTLHAINPRLCIASLVGYPESGPWRDRAGHDLNFQALSGMLSLFSEQPGLPLGELLGAYDGAFSFACALREAQAAGRGRRVVVSFHEVLRGVQSRLFREFKETRKEPKPGETLFSGLYPCYHLYHSKDGRRIAVGALEHKFWEKVCEIAGRPELVPHAYATGAEGKKTIEALQSALGAKPWNEWAPRFEEANCCVEPVLSYSELS